MIQTFKRYNSLLKPKKSFKTPLIQSLKMPIPLKVKDEKVMILTNSSSTKSAMIRTAA